MRSPLVIALGVGLIATFAVPAPAQITNDECTGSIPLGPGANGPFSSVGATTSFVWPCAGGGSDVWYSYAATTNGLLSIDLCGSSYDTALEIFTGPCASLASIACNDDSCFLESALQVPSTTGQTYLFRVGGFQGDQGSFVVNIVEIPPLVNDECVNAIPVAPGQNGPFSNIGATDNPSDPIWPCAAGGSDVWFVMQSACSQSIEINTCRASSYDTAIEILSGTCGSLVSVTCNDDFCGLQTSVSFQAVPGTNYYIRAGGFFGGQGTFTLDINISGNGGFSTALPGCGQATLTASGSPNLGGAVSYQMNNVAGTPVIWLGLQQFSIPLCPPAGCQLGTTFDVVLPFGSASFGGPVPCDSTLRNRTFYIQGLDLGGIGGCPPSVLGVGITTTEVIATTIG